MIAGPENETINSDGSCSVENLKDDVKYTLKLPKRSSKSIGQYITFGTDGNIRKQYFFVVFNIFFERLSSRNQYFSTKLVF